MKYLKLFENKITDENLLDDKIIELEINLKKFDDMLIDYIIGFAKSIGCVDFRNNIFDLSKPNLRGLRLDGKIEIYEYFKNIYTNDPESLLSFEYKDAKSLTNMILKCKNYFYSDEDILDKLLRWHGSEMVKNVYSSYKFQNMLINEYPQELEHTIELLSEFGVDIRDDIKNKNKYIFTANTAGLL